MLRGVLRRILNKILKVRVFTIANAPERTSLGRKQKSVKTNRHTSVYSLYSLEENSRNTNKVRWSYVTSRTRSAREEEAFCVLKKYSRFGDSVPGSVNIIIISITQKKESSLVLNTLHFCSVPRTGFPGVCESVFCCFLAAEAGIELSSECVFGWKKLLEKRTHRAHRTPESEDGRGSAKNQRIDEILGIHNLSVRVR